MACIAKLVTYKSAIAFMSIMFPAPPTNPPERTVVKDWLLDGAAVGPATVGDGAGAGVEVVGDGDSGPIDWRKFAYAARLLLINATLLAEADPTGRPL